MPDLDLINQEEQARDQRGQFSQAQMGFTALEMRFNAFEQRFSIQQDPISRILAILVRLAERQAWRAIHNEALHDWCRAGGPVPDSVRRSLRPLLSAPDHATVRDRVDQWRPG